MPDDFGPPAPGRDPRFKLGLLLLTGVLAITLENPAPLAALALAGVCGLLLARPAKRELLLIGAALFLSAWGLVLSQGLFYRQGAQTALLVLLRPEATSLGRLTGGISFTLEGALHGAVQSLRLAATLSAGMAVALTTEPSRLLAGLSRMGVPPSVAFCTATALRFLPVAAAEARAAFRAQRLRGLHLAGGGGWSAVRAAFRAARPLLAASIRRAETVALAAAGRAYDPVRPRTQLRPLKMTGPEKGVLLLGIFLAAAAAAAKILYALYAAGLYYHPALRDLYTLTREML